MGDETPAHEQSETHKYVIHFPEHAPRATDPHYAAFEALKKHLKATGKYRCFVGERIGFDQCEGDLEAHHRILEFSLINAVDLDALKKDFPALTDLSQVPAWAESDDNIEILCVKHHRSAGNGVHAVAFSDWEAGLYIRNLLSEK